MSITKEHHIVIKYGDEDPEIFLRFLRYLDSRLANEDYEVITRLESKNSNIAIYTSQVLDRAVEQLMREWWENQNPQHVVTFVSGSFQ